MNPIEQLESRLTECLAIVSKMTQTDALKNFKSRLDDCYEAWKAIRPPNKPKVKK